MPLIIDYTVVLQRLESEGLHCNYPNGGSFGFAPEAAPQVRGWIGLADPTIRPAMQPMIRHVASPFELNLAKLACWAWEQLLPGNLWAMPASHWSHELHHGSREWMGALLTEMNLDRADLAARTDAAAIEFVPGESAVLCRFVQQLLENLAGSDFMLAFPGRAAVCSVHHHKQLWWSTTNVDVLRGLDGLAG
jgi:hypothetical protein